MLDFDGLSFPAVWGAFCAAAVILPNYPTGWLATLLAISRFIGRRTWKKTVLDASVSVVSMFSSLGAFVCVQLASEEFLKGNIWSFWLLVVLLLVFTAITRGLILKGPA